MGIFDGTNLASVATVSKNVVGVDTEDKFQLKERFGDRFFQGTTDEFFAQNRRTYDVIFIDADHSFASVKKDFVNSLKILNPMGIILIHDTNPMSEYLKEPGYCGDSWKMHRYLGETWPDLDKINLDITEAGLMMVKRRDEIRCYLGD
jgi:predicted O-methyltransferase YrrM